MLGDGMLLDKHEPFDELMRKCDDSREEANDN